MPPLKNISHEKLAHAVIKEESATKAYLSVYPESSVAAARSSVSDVLAKPDVRNRIHELLEQNKCGISRITERYKEFLEDNSEKSLAWDAVKTGLKIYGAFDEDSGKKNIQNVQINILNVGK